MKQAVKVVFGSGSEARNQELVLRMRDIAPQLPLYVVSEFPPAEGRWIPYHPFRTFRENLALCRTSLKGKRIQIASVLLDPKAPYLALRIMAMMLAPLRLLFYNENLDHFVLRPRSAGTIARHILWRMKSWGKWQLHPGGDVYTFFWRMRHPHAWKRPLLVKRAQIAGLLASRKKRHARHPDPLPEPALPQGISVVIPSRDGRTLLERLLPGVERDLQGIRAEIIVVDNCSSDGTAEFLSGRAEVEHSAAPLSFARAVNRGIRRARFSHVLLLNNDMVIEPDFFSPLLRAFSEVPNLFCATAQILFPEGMRRQETGKAVMPPGLAPHDFPIRCELPIEGENLSYVLYGSGGCSLYDTVKLRQLGGAAEVFEPAYVEDLDLGYRAWTRGWPSIFVSEARVVHFHRSTASRYYSERELTRVLEINYLRFLARSIVCPDVFLDLWARALNRLNLMAVKAEDSPAMEALAAAGRAHRWVGPRPLEVFDDELILAIGSGDVAVFPGRRAADGPNVLIASSYVPYPLSHGGAVRMYNLMRRATPDFGQILVAFCDHLNTPPAELLEICEDIVLVRRRGSHRRRSTDLPDIVEEFDSTAFRAALRLMCRKHRPGIAQLEFTQMAQYASDCAPAKTILVEHDITLDLYAQLLEQTEDWEMRRQWQRWVRFEIGAWGRVDRVVTMSKKDRQSVTAGNAISLPNGVDLQRFQPSIEKPEPRRILFIGSFRHLPNVMAVDFFVRDAWPLLAPEDARLHVIAGVDSAYFLERYNDRVGLELHQPGIIVEDFVPDVRPAYRQAAVVIAPLVASAGTNIKIMEAMAMGKVIVSTPAGINGLDLDESDGVIVTRTGVEMAAAILDLFRNPQRRRDLERRARAAAEAKYDWDVIAAQQAEMYRELLAGSRSRTEENRVTV